MEGTQEISMKPKPLGMPQASQRSRRSSDEIYDIHITDAESIPKINIFKMKIFSAPNTMPIPKM